MMQDIFVKELRKFLDCQGMLGIDVLTPWRSDYIVMTFTSPEGVECLLKIKDRNVEVATKTPTTKTKAKSVRSSKKV